MIIQAEPVSTKELTFEVRSPVDGQVHSTITEVLHLVRVNDVLKGEIAVGSEIPVLTTKSSSRDLPWGGTGTIVQDVPAMRPGTKYGLFLRSVPRTGYHTDEVPAVFYARPAEPGLAELLPDGRLLFLVSAGYREQAKERGLIAAGEQVPGDFQIDIAGLKTAIGRNDAESAAPPPTAGPPRTPDPTKQALIDEAARQ
jgi:hypothetical protein